ncbi:MAG: outer membrane beta-barrel protein [Planctomycetes bacterium]|nr:outer membrane beta-barrel protein [Planctomycetota bacterium]
MRHGRWATPLAMLLLFAAAEAHGQTYPRTARQTSYLNTYRSYYGQPETQQSPSDVPVPPMDVGPMNVAPPAGPAYIPESCDPVCVGGCYGGNGCAPSCGVCCEPSCCDDCGCNGDDDEPWRLFGDMPLIPGATGDCCREPLSFFIGGHISGGITGNADGNRSSQGNFPVPFNQVSDGFVWNQAPYIYAEKEVDTGGEGFDWGLRVDYLFGTDAPDTQAFGDGGWDFGWNSSRDYGSAIPQLYADLGYDNWTLRLGHFYTIIGYEVVPATGNFFYSHALTHNYGEPFTHTGGLVTYTPDDVWTYYGGYTFGWDSGFENLNDAHTFLGGVSYAWEDIGTLTWAFNTGDFGDGDALGGTASSGDIYMSSLIGTVNVTDEIEYVIQHDHGVNFNVPGGPGSEWYGINQYLFIALTEYIRFGARVEWFDDADGARIGAHPFAAPAAVALGPTEGDYFNYTLGLNIAPNANFMVRPEVRWERFSGTAPPGALPFDNGRDDELFTAGIDMVLQF